MNTLSQDFVNVPNKSAVLTDLGVTINSSITMLYLRPVGKVHFRFNGVAGITSAPLPEGYTGYPVDSTSAALFQFWSPADHRNVVQRLDVLQVG